MLQQDNPIDKDRARAYGKLGGRPKDHHRIDPDMLKAYQGKPLASKQEILKTLWADMAFTCLKQAESFASAISKKDFGRLVQILSSAGIAYDKVCPKTEVTSLSFNLFKGLPLEQVKGVLGNGGLSPTIETQVIKGLSD